ncbi:hypothetical protein SPRG_17865, partial [Saprolegnia parasitica CBS 223.65]
SACTSVSVEGDATYCILGSVCVGAGIAPLGIACPRKGAVASADCNSNAPSFLTGSTCVLSHDAVCQKLATGAWGCALSSSHPTDEPCPTERPRPTDAPCPTERPRPTDAPCPTERPHLSCTLVSVQGDATYCINGPVCSGAGLSPDGVSCPDAGTVASGDCHPHLGSYVAASNSCVLSKSATCQKTATGAWGCVPST